MQDYAVWLFQSPSFMPHGMCYLWQPGTLWLNVASDGLIAAAYYAIPISLYYLVHERRKEIPFRGIILMFAAFIVLCGTTHLMEIWTVWHPDYRLAGALKGITGIVSVATMFALFKVIPHAMQLRSPAQLQQEVGVRTAQLANLNEELRAQVDARDQAEAQLRDRDQRKDEFLATLAHELRNPLAPIRHAVRILGEAAATAEQQRWGLEVIDRQAHRMALLLDDLLEVSRITRGQLVLKKQRVTLADLITAAVETARPLIDSKELILTVGQPAEQDRLRGGSVAAVASPFEFVDECGEVHAARRPNLSGCHQNSDRHRHCRARHRHRIRSDPCPASLRFVHSGSCRDRRG